MITFVPRAELVRDAAWAEWDAEHGGSADRCLTLLSAVFYCVWWLACVNGLDPDWSAGILWDARATGPWKGNSCSGDKVRDREKTANAEAERQKRFFEGLKKRLFDGGTE